MKRSLFLSLLLLAGAVVRPAWAGSGYFSGEKGARAGGRAGAFTARADDLSAVMYNPAGLGHLTEPTLQVGNRVTHNALEFSRAATLDWGHTENGVAPLVDFSPVENQTPWQGLEPFAGFATRFGLKDWVFSLVAFAPPGIGRERFPVDGGQRYMMVYRNAQILDYTLSAAWHRGDRFGFGVSLHWIDVAKLEYALVIDANPLAGGQGYPVYSPFDMRADISGADHFTPNAVVGAWFRPLGSLELGVAAQVIPASIRTKSTLEVQPLNPDFIDSFGGEEIVLRRNGQNANDVDLILPLPLTARAGVRYFRVRNGRELFDVELDVVYETWSAVDEFRLDSHGISGEIQNESVPVGVIDIEKEWRDTLGLHLGGDYAVVPGRVTLRAGTAFESAVAEPAFAHVDFVSGSQLSGTLGASIFAGTLEIAVAYSYIHELPVRVSEADGRVYQEVPGSQCPAPYTDPVACDPNYLGQPSPTVNAGEYRARSHVAALDLLYRF